MFGSTILDIAIGVVFIYLLLSLMCSALNEMVAWILGLRAKTLKTGIEQLLADPAVQGLAARIYSHPLVKPLAQKGKDPSYIPSRTFALALMDVVMDTSGVKPGAPAVAAGAGGAAAAAAPLPVALRLGDVQNAIAALPANSELRKSLMLVVNGAMTDLNQARESIEKWFDDSMQRVSGWYKRKTHLILLFWAALVSIGFNVDTILLAQTLSHDTTLRNTLVAQAQQAATDQSTNNSSTQPAAAIAAIDAKIKELRLPIGWDGGRLPADFQAWAQKIVGLLLTMIALSLGAPFWFDTLNKIVNMRAGGKPPEKAKT